MRGNGLNQSEREERNRQIIELRAGGMAMDDLAMRFDLSQQRIEQIVHSELNDARRAVNTAVRTGAITRPSICESCATTDGTMEAHHEDYSAPLDVSWLCKACHRAADSERRKRLGIKRQRGTNTLWQLR